MGEKKKSLGNQVNFPGAPEYVDEDTTSPGIADYVRQLLGMDGGSEADNRPYEKRLRTPDTKPYKKVPRKDK